MISSIYLSTVVAMVVVALVLLTTVLLLHWVKPLAVREVVPAGVGLAPQRGEFPPRSCKLRFHSLKDPFWIN